MKKRKPKRRKPIAYQYDFGGNVTAGLTGLVSGALGSIPLVGPALQGGVNAIGEGIQGPLSNEEKSIRGYGSAAGGIATGLATGNIGGAIASGAAGIGQGIASGNTNSQDAQNIGRGLGLAGQLGGLAYGKFGNPSSIPGVQSTNLAPGMRPFPMTAKNGGSMNYHNGGMHPNAELEKQENVVYPNGQTQQFNGPSHEAGGIQTNLPQGTRIFSDNLKGEGKKTYADLAKKYATEKYVKTLEDSKAGKIAKDTAKIMLEKNNKALDNLFTQQEAFKAEKLNKALGRAQAKYGTTTPESSHMMSDGSIMPNSAMYANGGTYQDSLNLYNTAQRNAGLDVNSQVPSHSMFNQERTLQEMLQNNYNSGKFSTPSINNNPIKPTGYYNTEGISPYYNKPVGSPEPKPFYNHSEATFKQGGWIQGAINPAHKGYCTPMSKETCTPHRKALAKRFKSGDLSKHADGGFYPTPTGQDINEQPFMLGQGAPFSLNTGMQQTPFMLGLGSPDQYPTPNGQPIPGQVPNQPFYPTPTGSPIAPPSSQPGIGVSAPGSQGFNWGQFAQDALPYAPAAISAIQGLQKPYQFNPNEFKSTQQATYTDRKFDPTAIQAQGRAGLAASRGGAGSGEYASRAAQSTANTQKALAAGQLAMEQVNLAGRENAQRANIGIEQNDLARQFQIAQANEQLKGLPSQFLTRAVDQFGAADRDRRLQAELRKLYGRV